MPNIPKVFVSAPRYVYVGERFYIHVQVRVDDINRIDSVEVEGHERKAMFGQRHGFQDMLDMNFGPYTISRSTNFRVIVRFDRRDRIVKYVDVNVRGRQRDDRDYREREFRGR